MTEPPPPPEPPPPARLHPPTSPRPIVHATAPSRWPGVVGTIAIVIASLSILASAWGVLQQVFILNLTAMVPGQEAMGAVYDRWRLPMIAVMASGALVAGVLLLGGILIVRRKPACRAVCLTYAALRTIQGVALAVVTGLMQQELVAVSMATTAANNPAVAAASGPVGTATAVASGAAVAMWAIAFPAFLFVWFIRPKIRREVRSWRKPEAAPATVRTGAM